MPPSPRGAYARRGETLLHANGLQHKASYQSRVWGEGEDPEIRFKEEIMYIIIFSSISVCLSVDGSLGSRIVSGLDAELEDR